MDPHFDRLLLQEKYYRVDQRGDPKQFSLQMTLGSCYRNRRMVEVYIEVFGLREFESSPLNGTPSFGPIVKSPL